MRSLVVFLLVLGFVSCSQQAPQYSGFLGNSSVYQQLTPHPQYQGVKIARFTDVPLSHYRKIILPPVKIYLSEDGYTRDINRNDLAELAMMFHNKLVEAATPQYGITNIPGDDVMILRIALTNANPYIPVDDISLARKLSGKTEGVATIEFEVVDSISGVTLLAGTATKQAKHNSFVTSMSKWGQVEEAINDWAQIIHERLEEEAKNRQ